MRTIIRYILISMITVGFIHCNTAKPKKSIENLKVAFNSESTAAEKYLRYSQAAMKEGFDTIAKLFEASAQSEGIHALSHSKVLEKLGGNVGIAELGTIEVKTTAENLQDAIKAESYEMQTMYPKFIRESENEKAAEAAKSFTWSMYSQIKQLQYYRKAQAAVANGTELGIPVTWYICPTCGNIYHPGDLKLSCDFCLTKQENFLGFTENAE